MSGKFPLDGRVDSTKRGVLAVMAIGLIALGWLLWRTDWDARAIHGRLRDLAELLEKDDSESTLNRMAGSRELRGFFTGQASVEYLPGRSPARGADAIGSAYFALRERVKTASVHLSGHEIDVAEADDRATSTVRVRVSVRMKNGDSRSGSHEYRIEWVEAEGAWRIRTVLLRRNR